MEGSPDGTFGVGRDITRGEFVTILCRFFLYAPESDVVYFDRAEVPISSTEIRDWALTHWDYSLPVSARP